LIPTISQIFDPVSKKYFFECESRHKPAEDGAELWEHARKRSVALANAESIIFKPYVEGNFAYILVSFWRQINFYISF
jgi:hypothetical protein